MLYYLYELSEWLPKHGIDNDLVKALNVFQYITFRAISAAVTAFLLCLIFGNRVIRKLISLKFGQPIRTAEEVNKLFELHGAKKGTPTMGGVLILGAVLISSLLWARPTNGFVWLVLISTVFLGGIGFYDDWLKVAKKSSDGISSRLKFLLQCVLAAGFTLYFWHDHDLWIVVVRTKRFRTLNPRDTPSAAATSFPEGSDRSLPPRCQRPTRSARGCRAPVMWSRRH